MCERDVRKMSVNVMYVQCMCVLCVCEWKVCTMYVCVVCLCVCCMRACVDAWMHAWAACRIEARVGAMTHQYDRDAARSVPYPAAASVPHTVEKSSRDSVFMAALFCMSTLILRLGAGVRGQGGRHGVRS